MDFLRGFGASGGDLRAYLEKRGVIFTNFDDQDSGCVSFGVEIEGDRWFVKHAPAGPPADSLERGLAFHRAVSHPAIIPPVAALATRAGLTVCSAWVEGEVLYHATRHHRPDRGDPASPHARFRAQPVEVVLAAIDTLYDAHLEVARRGFAAVDLYDGCFLYDFERLRLHLCDLDEYRRAPFFVDADRLPGSSRFMAPEEWRRGALIDERTTVFALGRAAWVLLDETDGGGCFRGSEELGAVIERATQPEPEDRYGGVAQFVTAWRQAAGGTAPTTGRRRLPRPR